MLSNKNYYPTEKFLIRKMLSDIDLKYISTILEPSCGSGNIVSYITEELKGYRYNNTQPDIDCIEIDNNLQSILKGKGFRVIHDDFLTFQTYKSYSLIIGNPPFDSGDKHLLKAIELAENQHNSCNIIFLLNAETIKNPYSNARKILINKLEELNADIEFIPDAFITAERKTSVEVALIKIKIQKESKLNDSFIYSSLKQDEQFQDDQNSHNSSNIIRGDFVQGIIDQYNFEITAGLKFIREYKNLKPLMLSNFNDRCKESIINLRVGNSDVDLENTYITKVRAKYWETLFTNDKFIGLFTSNLKTKYYNKIHELKNYDFSLFNITTIQNELNKEMLKSVEQTILDLFEEFSHKHSWHDEQSKNIHYFNGWSTNKAYKINKKIIIPLDGYNWYHKDQLDLDYKVKDKLTDIEKIMNYLDNNRTAEVNLIENLEKANNSQNNKKIDTKYFLLTFYKKRTCHIEFKDMELLDKFNIFGSRKLGFLPESYGKKSYKDMTTEEKHIVNNFHQGKGEESYRKIYENQNYYITETSNLLMLT